METSIRRSRRLVRQAQLVSFDRTHVLNVLHDWIVKHGEPPTILELTKALKVKSTRTAVRYLKLLEDDGSLERRGARGVVLRRAPVDAKAAETVSVPLIGTVAAGKEHIENGDLVPVLN